MSKLRLPTPASIAKLQQKPDPGFRDRRSGAILAVGPITPREPRQVNKPANSGDPKYYRNK